MPARRGGRGLECHDGEPAHGPADGCAANGAPPTAAQSCQYASEACREHLAAWQVTPSMSRRGNCYDNAATESFWSTLKEEHVRHRAFASRAEVAGAIFDHTETFYNHARLHSALGYLSPLEFEKQHNPN